MSCARLRRALSSRAGGEPAVVPLVEAHAARLEQLCEDRWSADGEALAPTLASLAQFFGAGIVSTGPARAPGAVALPPADFLVSAPSPGWLRTTTAELDPLADSTDVRAAIERWRAPRAR